jgi:hypothetical protein
MNHCIIGGVGDGDSGEDGGDEQRGVRAATAAAPARGTPSLPASWGAPPLSPLPSWLHESPGGGKNVALVAANSWAEVSPTS